MAQHIRRYGLPHKNIYLIFGTRAQRDLIYVEEMKQLEKDLTNFYFLPTLSREQWSGCCGYVHAVYEGLVAEKQQAAGALPDAQFFLCGWKAMVDEAKRRILALGFDKKQIHLELYG
jgi:CDP-4-dehydro-6-deoxyglucose reductase